MPPRKPLHNHPPPKQPSRRKLGTQQQQKQQQQQQPRRPQREQLKQQQQREQRRRRSPARDRKQPGSPTNHWKPRRSPSEKRQARAELRAVRDALDGLAYHNKDGEVRFVGQRHGMASGVDLREAWTATTRLDELASSRDAKMEELEHAHARAVGNLTSAKEQLVQAAQRLATERVASGRTSATYSDGSPYRRGGQLRMSPSRTTAATAVEDVMDDALQSAKAALAAAGGDFNSPRKRPSADGRSTRRQSSAEAVRGRAGSRVRAAEVAARDAAYRAREARHQSKVERRAVQEPMRELEEWVEVQPSTPVGDVRSPVAEGSTSGTSNRGLIRRASAEPQAMEEAATRPGHSVRPAGRSIELSGASAAVGMDIRRRSSSPLRARSANSKMSARRPAVGSEVSSAVVWGSVRRHMTAVNTHRRRAAAAAVRKCPPVARRLLATALYRCPAVHPPRHTRSPNLQQAKTSPNPDGRSGEKADLSTHPHEGRRISRTEFRAACADVTSRHTALGHNLSTATVDTLTEWFRCEDDPAAIALLPLAAACDLPEPPPPPAPRSGSPHAYRPTSELVSSSSPEPQPGGSTLSGLDSSLNASSTSATGKRSRDRSSSVPKSRPYSTELSRQRARNAKGYRRASTPPPQGTRSQRRQQERDDAWQRERERTVAVLHPVTPSNIQHQDTREFGQQDALVNTGANEKEEASPVQPSFDDPTQWGLDSHHGGLRSSIQDDATVDIDPRTNTGSPQPSSTAGHGSGSVEVTTSEPCSPVGQRISPRTSGSYRPETKHAFGTHVPPPPDNDHEHLSGKWRSAPEPPEPPPPPPSTPGPLFSPDVLAGSPVSPERLARGEDWRASLIDQRVADRIAAAATEATTAAASAVKRAATAAHSAPTATTRPVASTPKRDSLETSLSDGFAGIPETPNFQTPLQRGTFSSLSKISMKSTPSRRSVPATPHTASENEQPRRASHSAARSPVLQLRMMLGTPEASRHLMRACTQCDMAEREHEGRTFAMEAGERRPDGTIRLDDWKTLLMTGRTGTVPRPADPMWQSQEEAETTGVTGAPLSGHAGGYAKLTAAQVDILEAIARRGGTVGQAKIGDQLVEIIDYRRFANSFGLCPVAAEVY